MAQSVKAAALRFLKIRPRSVAELKEKLAGKGFPADEIEAVLNDFTASGLLDDRAFTKSWINYRLARPFGFRRIVGELKNKGIDPGIIEESVAAIKESYSPEEVAMDLARRRWQRLPNIDPLKKRKRVLDFLLRRGFDADVAMKAVKKL